MVDDNDDDKPVTGAVLASAFDKLADRLASLAPAPAAAPVVAADPPAPAKVYTRAELTQAVEDGKINQATADAVWEKQIREAAAADAVATVRAEGAAEKVNAEITKFYERVPALKDRNSPEYAKVKAEFERLGSLGFATTKTVDGWRTELAALQAVFPPAAADLGPGERGLTTSPESFGGGGPGGRRKPAERDTDPPSDLTPRQRQHYERLVGPGMLYPDWKAVREELKHARPSARGRAA